MGSRRIWKPVSYTHLTKGEPGTGDVVQAVRHMRMMQAEIRRIGSMAEDELFDTAKQLQVPY